MTKHEAAVIETYTGIVMLTGDNTKYVYEYADKLKELSKPDFIEICRNLED